MHVLISGGVSQFGADAAGELVAGTKGFSIRVELIQ